MILALCWGILGLALALWLSFEGFLFGIGIRDLFGGLMED